MAAKAVVFSAPTAQRVLKSIIPESVFSHFELKNQPYFGPVFPAEAWCLELTVVKVIPPTKGL